MSRFTSRFRQLNNALRYLVRGDLSGLVNRVKWYGREYSHVKLRRRLLNGDGVVWGILCTPHTVFIARKISDRLAFHGIKSEVIVGSVKSFKHDFYVVLCAQMFKRLPPASKRVIFQLEQSVSSRWFTPEYITALMSSLAVLEYSLTNIDFLAELGVKYPSVHYLPIGASGVGCLTDHKPQKKYDFIFYGDSLSSDRRREFLKKLQEKYSVKICNDLFGSELYEAIRDAKAVINIHYYEAALLEMPRLCECISLGTPVLSEGTADQDEYPELGGAVTFFDEGSIDSMMACASEMLDRVGELGKAIDDAVSASAVRFNFMFDRFLVAIGTLSPNVILENPIYVSQKRDCFVLSLPETIERRKAIIRSMPEGFVLFDGIRHNLGWIGCGGSFNALSRYGLANKLHRLTIIEDDVDLPEDFTNILSEINGYLDARKEEWDIFSGLMADIHPNTKVLSVEQVGGRTYVTIDRMTSTVFNIYNKTAMEMLSQWDPLDTDAVTNTIDRYLERQKTLRVVVALPFIVGHKEEAMSTLWGFENIRYTPMITEAQKKIEALCREWEISKKII